MSNKDSFKILSLPTWAIGLLLNVVKAVYDATVTWLSRKNNKKE